MTKNEKWFMLDVGQVEKKLKTNAASGLSRKAARSRWSKETGSVYIPRRKSTAQILGELVADFSWILLLLATVFSWLFDDFQRGISVLALAVLHLAATFFWHYRSQRTLESMQACFRPFARVIRGGGLYLVDYTQVVVGDVLLIERGDVVRADMRLVTSESLRVRTMTDKDHTVSLEKYAGGAIRPNENQIEHMTNMVHAGSVVEQGSARGIVTAVGQYTYLAAKTGGIPESECDNTPACLKRMKKLCSTFSMISLVCILPFCLISLFVSHLISGDVLLSASFLTALALTTCFMTQLSLTVCNAFFVIWIRRQLSQKHPTAVRSVSAMERLNQSEYLFVLDGGALSDGHMHFDVASTFEGEITQYDNLSPTVSTFGRLTALYCMAEKRSLSVGIDVADQLPEALMSFCERCRADQEELQIRYPKLTYFPGNARGSLDSVRYIENGRERWISLSFEDVLSRCDAALVHGTEKPLTAEGISRLHMMRQGYMALGKQVLILTVFDTASDLRTFVGMLVLRDGTDPALRQKLSELQKTGMRPILFTPKHKDSSIPDIPECLRGIPRVSALWLKEKNLPITYEFGKYLRYDDVEEEDILLLLRVLKKNNKRVTVLALSDYAPTVMKEADVRIVCSSVKAGFSGYLDEEIHTMESDGRATSASCLQSLKGEADVLIARPTKHGGGLHALISLRRATRSAYRSLAGFFDYLLGAQLLRIVAIALPMLFGSASLDARHVLFCGFFMDLVALGFFASDKSPTNQKRREADDFLQYAKAKIPLWITALVGGLSTILLPRLFGWLGLFGAYHHKVEFSFVSIIALHFVLLLVLRYDLLSQPRKLLSDVRWMIYGAVLIAFLAICFLLRPIGVLFDVEGQPIGFWLLSFAPSLLAALSYWIATHYTSKK